MRLVIGTSVELGADMAAASLEELGPVTRFAVRGDEGVDVVCGNLVLPDADVHVTIGPRRERGVEMVAEAPPRPDG
jgi:hypothetical protein